MTAVTANQLTPQSDDCELSMPVALSTNLYERTLAFVNSGGYADDDTASGANRFAGIVKEQRDNSAGGNGDLKVTLIREGKHILTGSSVTQAWVGVPIYATDNYTITNNGAASGAVYIGIGAEYISTTQLKVEIDPKALASASSAAAITTQVLTFNGATGVNEIVIPTNLADALSIESSAGDILAIDTTTGTVVLTIGANVRLNVAGSAQIGNATTDLVAFHGSTPTDQCAAYTQTFSTADRTHAARTATALTVTDGAGTNDGTIGAITADASVIAAIQELAAAVNALIVDLADTAGVVNAVVDDLQEKGLVG